MATVLLVAYLLVVLALIAVILLQRSEGGGLGMGGGGGGGFMSARGSANVLTRTTAILATLFFVMAIGLTLIAEVDRGTDSILDRASDGSAGAGSGSVLDALNDLQDDEGDLPVPATEAPATDAPATEAPAEETPAPADAPAADEPELAVPDAPAENGAGAGN